ncbi:MAG: tyrosine-type recombinase/integrase [Anaerolineae bacterium]|nr:tyrosine-type recombinase/integrase [Anaerolineae bacterium]
MKTTSLKSPVNQLRKYTTWLKRQPLSDATRRSYRSRVGRFLEYLAEAGEDLVALFDSDRELEHVLKSYKRHLKVKSKLSPATVNAHLTAIDHFIQYHGQEPPEVPREDLPQEAPRALEKDEQKRFLRAVAGSRRSIDRAVNLLLLYTGIRIGECAALEVDDVFVVGRKRKVVVRSGKGDYYREIPLNEEAAKAVQKWLKDREERFGQVAVEPALFLNPQGRRISTAALDLIVRKVGDACGLSVSAHRLRHTLLTNLVRNKTDLVLVAEIGGHKKLETTRRYTLPSSGDKEKAMADLLDP